VGSYGSYHHQSARSPSGPAQGGTAGGGVVGGLARDAPVNVDPSGSVTTNRVAVPLMVIPPL